MIKRRQIARGPSRILEHISLSKREEFLILEHASLPKREKLLLLETSSYLELKRGSDKIRSLHSFCHAYYYVIINLYLRAESSRESYVYIKNIRTAFYD